MAPREPKPMTEVIDFAVIDGAEVPKRSSRRLTMMSALATGWLPWGVEWHPSLTLSHEVSEQYPFNPIRPHFVLCCGHTMKMKEAQAFVSAGLLTAGVSRHGDEALVITPAGEAWLERNWIS